MHIVAACCYYLHGRVASDFIHTLLTRRLIPVINQTTRLTKNSATIINNIITDDNCILHLFSTNLLYEAVSDHFSILLLVDSAVELHNNVAQPNRTRQHNVVTDDTVGDLEDLLAAVNRHAIIDINNPDDAFRKFMNITSAASNLAC